MKTVKWSSKGQIGMMEMIMVTIIVTILIIIGMVFYFKFSASSIEKTGERISEDKAAVITATITQLPEIECTYLGSRTAKACADTIKLLALSTKDSLPNTDPEFIEHRRHYSNLLGPMIIKFEQLYPETTGTECTQIPAETPPDILSCGNWTIYDNPKANIEPVFRTMPIALYYPTKGMYSFGQLKVYIY